MNRLALLSLLLLCQQSGFAAVYKCDAGGGRVGYQATPCANGHAVDIDTTPGHTAAPVAAAAPASAAGPEKKRDTGKAVTIHFDNVQVTSMLQLLADFSGYKLVLDPSVTGSGAFHYDRVAWDAVLQDVASRHKLTVKIENKTIFARSSAK